ncbi:MAG: hypothetical protein WAM78_00455 [Candidatus Sulfotelmatobacter sp.]
MKRTSILTAFLVALALISTGCGTSDYLESVTISAAGATPGGTYNLPGVNATLQLQVSANYHSGKSVDVTDSSTFTVTTQGVDANTGDALPPYGPTTVPINTTGLMTAVEYLCTWQNTATSATASAVWVLTGNYNVVANYRGMASPPIGIGVGSAVDTTSLSGGCGPTTTP